MHTQDNFSVIICAYTEARWDALQAAIASIQNQTLPAHEIVVVIDHNPALFQRLLEAYPDRQLVILENHFQTGLSGARNTGVRRATGAILAFLDDDAVACPDWLHFLNEAYHTPDVAGAGGKIEMRWQQRQPKWFPEEFAWVVGCTYRGHFNRITHVRNLIGTSMSFRRAVLREVGGFRSDIGRVGAVPLGCEETELCIRIQQAMPGKYVIYDPRATVHHLITPLRATRRYFLSRCYHEGLSKAAIVAITGRQKGLASEREYTFKTLPRGVVRGLYEAIQGNPAGCLRSLAIVAGFAATLAGYVRGRLKTFSSSLIHPSLPIVGHRENS